MPGIVRLRTVERGLAGPGEVVILHFLLQDRILLAARENDRLRAVELHQLFLFDLPGGGVGPIKAQRHRYTNKLEFAE